MTGLTRDTLLVSLGMVCLCPLGGQERRPSTAQPTKIELAVRVQKTADDYYLHATFTNKESAPLLIDRTNLPWGSRNSLLLAAHGIYRDPRGDFKYADFPPPTGFPIMDSMPGKLVIKPGERLEGSFSLSLRFEALMEMLQKHDVILFWSYQLKPLKRNPTERFGGWLLIPGVGAKKQ